MGLSEASYVWDGVVKEFIHSLNMKSHMEKSKEKKK